uniref:Methyltransferase domain-containing protein n=1 Tax=Alexandrium monilatum TaxID=311494 RepID=A0A7S4R075_9DINO
MAGAASASSTEAPADDDGYGWGDVWRVACSPSRPFELEASVSPLLTVSENVLRQSLDCLEQGTGGITLPFLELGSGSGRASICAASRLGVRAVGLELEEGLVEEARATASTAGVAHLCEFRQEDVMERRWATGPGTWGVAFVHLLPEALAKLEPSLLGLECPIICINYKLPRAAVSASGIGWTIYCMPAARYCR